MNDLSQLVVLQQSPKLGQVRQEHQVLGGQEFLQVYGLSQSPTDHNRIPSQSRGQQHHDAQLKI